MTSVRERAYRNSLVAFTTYFANLLVRWLIQVMVARTLLKRDVGSWNLLQSVAQVVILLAGLGFHGSLLRAAMRRPRLAARFWFHASAVRVVLTLACEAVALALLLVATWGGWLDLRGHDFVVLGILYLGCLAVALKVSPVLEAFQRMDVFYRAQVWMSYGAFVLLAVAFYVMEWKTPITLVVVQQIAGDAVILGMIWYLHRRLARIEPKVRWSRCVVMAWRSIPKGLETLFSESLQIVDKIMIALLVGFVASADYWLAVVYTQIGALLLERIYRILRPSILEGAYRRDRRLLERRFATFLRVFSAMSIPMAVGSAMTALDFIPRIYGDDYWNAVLPAMILSMTGFAQLYYRTYLDVLFAHDDDRRLVAVSGGASALNVALNFGAISLWGTSGAAAASVTAFLVAAWFGWREIRRYATIEVTRHVMKPLVATVPMAAAMVAVLPWGFAAQFVIGTVVWGAVLLMLRHFSRAEYDMVLRGPLARLRPLVRERWCRPA